MCKIVEKQLKKKIVFFPYKTAMWDSLESIWQAVRMDDRCECKVVAIPYYNRLSDGSFGELCYEGELFPDYVEIEHYADFDLENENIDIAYIHNPYDDRNHVTSVEPKYYSWELKKYVKNLVYVPYYATTGGMSEGQRSLSAYENVDYIVTQSEKQRGYFDENLSDDKFLPFGSPKFDRVIELSKKNIQELVSQEWIDIIGKRRVYFYNTSLGGALFNTENFLQKIEYVFSCFEKNREVCLLWRPHPLLEQMLSSLREEYYKKFLELKTYYINNRIGIYDDTPDIEKSIAISYGYIGDSGTSVTSLFGIAGKPMFILNNMLHHGPEEDDYRGDILNNYLNNDENSYIVTPSNQVYQWINNKYRYLCSLSDYTGGNLYGNVIDCGEKQYVLPLNASDICVLKDGKLEKKLKLENKYANSGSFVASKKVGDYIFLIPNRYPDVVKLDTRNDIIDYISGCRGIFLSIEGTDWRDRVISEPCAYGEYLMLASTTSNRILAINSIDNSLQLFQIGSKEKRGNFSLQVHGEDIWMLPYEGHEVIKWNPISGEVREYNVRTSGFRCYDRLWKRRSRKRPYSSLLFTDDKVIIAPYWGSQFVELDCKNGVCKEWSPTIEQVYDNQSDYYDSLYVAKFFEQNGRRYLYNMPSRKLYEIDDKLLMREMEMKFSMEELREHKQFFGVCSPWLQYCAMEDWNLSISKFVAKEVESFGFNKVKQLESYAAISANIDGTCGRKIHEYMMNKVNR